MANARLPALDLQKVRMIYLEQDIGAGTATGDDNRITIGTDFEWPPQSQLKPGALVAGLFDLTLLDETTCAVKASYPGILPEPIETSQADYFVFLIGARPQFHISTPFGAHLVFGATGPFHQPEEVTGYSLGIAEPERQPLSFVFRTRSDKTGKRC